MDLAIKWHQPLKLIDASEDNLIFTIEALETLFDGAGVYMFCRRYDASLKPLYIGKSINIQKRIKQHLNSVKMMKGIGNAQKGEKVLVVGEFIPKRGQNLDKSISIVETALIEHAITEGYELLNELCTKWPTHQISFNGYMLAKKLSGSSQKIKI